MVGYRKTYRLRNAVPGRKSIEVTFPYAVVERQARRESISIGEFLKRFQATAEYGSFEGVRYNFVEIAAETDESGKTGG